MASENIQRLLINQLEDLYDAEKQLTRALRKMAKEASSEAMAAALVGHLETTREQAARLEEAFENLGRKARSRPCRGMKGIIDEANEDISEHSGAETIDAVLAAGGRRVEHYEVAAYSSAIELAQQLGNQEVVRLLKQTLTEEERMDRKLAQLSGRLLKQTMREAA